MQSLTVIPETKKFELVDGPVPKITRPDQVLIKVAYAGFYESGLHLLEGNADSERLFHFRHELSGTIMDIGNEVKHFKKGDRVTVGPNAGCGSCLFCRSGRPYSCLLGSDSTIGTWASFVVVPVTRIYKVPDNVTLQQVLLTKPLSQLINALQIAGPITVGMKILITGAGILGSLWAQVLYHQGHRQVTVIDNHNKLDSLKRNNTGFTLTTRDELKKREKTSSSYYFDLVVETSGDPSVMEQVMSHLQKGGKLCCCQMASPNAEFSVYPFEVFMRELKIFSVNENCFSFQAGIRLIEAMGNR
ncbi:unnamed protein product [Callosobruchus maculatus]|nr:unnamed protein product [Callosobruchus maculatus]